jgi:hypothetical protein
MIGCAHRSTCPIGRRKSIGTPLARAVRRVPTHDKFYAAMNYSIGNLFRLMPPMGLSIRSAPDPKGGPRRTWTISKR